MDELAPAHRPIWSVESCEEALAMVRPSLPHLQCDKCIIREQDVLVSVEDIARGIPTTHRKEERTPNYAAPTLP